MICSLEVSLPLQGRPCGRPPAAAVLGRPIPQGRAPSKVSYEAISNKARRAVEKLLTNAEDFQGRAEKGATKARKKASKLEDNAEALFNDPENRTYLTGPYLDLLQENLRDLSSAFGRSLALALLVVAAFELLTRAALGTASLGPFEISDLSLVHKALPIVGGYLFYDIMTVSFRGGAISQVYRRILELQQPDFAKADLLILIPPHRSSLIPQRTPGAKPTGLHLKVSGVLYNLMIFALPFWVIYAFSVLFRKFHITDLAVWAGLLISLLFVTLGITIPATLYEKEGVIIEDK